jgi:hypothetical protein
MNENDIDQQTSFPVPLPRRRRMRRVSQTVLLDLIVGAFAGGILGVLWSISFWFGVGLGLFPAAGSPEIYALMAWLPLSAGLIVGVITWARKGFRAAVNVTATGVLFACVNAGIYVLGLVWPVSQLLTLVFGGALGGAAGGAMFGAILWGTGEQVE